MLKFPSYLLDDDHDALKLIYLSKERVVCRREDRFGVYANDKWHIFDARVVKRLKVDGYLKITKSSSRTGREDKMMMCDLVVEELRLTAKGLAMAKTCAERRKVYYLYEEGTLVYGSLKDFGYLQRDCFHLRLGSTRRHLLLTMSEGTRLHMKPSPTKANPDALGLFLVDGRFLGTLSALDVEPWWIEHARFRPQQLVVEVTGVGADSVSGHVFVRTLSKNNVGLPEDPDDAALKAALAI